MHRIYQPRGMVNPPLDVGPFGFDGGTGVEVDVGALGKQHEKIPPACAVADRQINMVMQRMCRVDMCIIKPFMKL